MWVLRGLADRWEAVFRVPFAPGGFIVRSQPQMKK
jgi:hypothetical protein